MLRIRTTVDRILIRLKGLSPDNKKGIILNSKFFVLIIRPPSRPHFLLLLVLLLLLLLVLVNFSQKYLVNLLDLLLGWIREKGRIRIRNTGSKYYYKNSLEPVFLLIWQLVRYPVWPPVKYLDIL